VTGGAGLLFATSEPPATWREIAQTLLPAEADIAEYVDERRGLTRIAAFQAGRLEGCIFVGPPDTLPSWDVVRGLFESDKIEEHDRRILLSGSGSDGAAETGPIVCACFGVGLPAIRETIAKGGATTVAEIGKTLRAGTNCGSCIPELRAILERVTEPA
jgi:assimilatory nitrate reductase catalytic subunit